MKKYLFAVLLLVGCGTGGKEDDTQATTQTEDNDCGDITFNVPEPELEEAIEEITEDGDEVVVEEMEPLDGGLDQQTRTFKIIVVGCNNTVVNEDNDSDDDIATTVNSGAAEQ